MRRFEFFPQGPVTEDSWSQDYAARCSSFIAGQTSKSAWISRQI